MKTRKTILKGTVSVSFFIVLVIFFFKSDNPAQTKQLDLNCPPPTVQKGIQCVLEEDVVLEETLELFSDTKLNCQDHTLTPATPGVESVCVCSDSFTSPCTCSSEHVASTPEAGIRLDGATGVKVQNCVIDGFDFGVVIQNEKVTTDDPVALAQQRNKILSNTITSLYQGVTLIDADNNQVSDNVISVSSGGGVHIFVAGDSDSNLITHNTVSGNTNPLNAAPLAPGRPSSPLPVGDRIFFIGDGIYLGNFFSNFTAEDNLVEGNTINLPNSSGGSVGVAVAELQKGTIVKENIFKAIPAAGVFVGVLRVPADPGTWPTDVLIEGNTLMGPMGNGIRIGDTFDPIIQGNSITGSTNFGIFIRGNAIETATITRNRIFNNGFGLRFRRDAFNSNATFYGAKIFLNDITGSTTQAVSRTANYNLTLCPDCTTELSVGVQGNYWGRPCSDSNGFREFGETGADSPAAFIKDSHPYEDSVAGKSDEELLEIEPCQ